MRIACLHVPQFALQCATRIDPSLRGGAVAVVGPGVVRGAHHGPVVLACSRGAWTLGCRVGMTAAAARATAAEIAIVAADRAVERETVRALADALGAVAPVTDVGGRVGAGAAHLAMYCEVPAKTRGSSFGDKVLAMIEQLGITARIGIADDRFTAWVAASEHGARASDHASGESSAEPDVITVPRGGSAAFLAPRPLALLAISTEVQHMLESLGVHTLGEFAALPAPAPSVHRPFEADYQALARGESGHALRGYAPESPIREEVVTAVATTAPLAAAGVLHGPTTGTGGSSGGPVLPGRTAGPSVPAAIALLAERIALRLAGRSRGAARLELVVTLAEGDQHVRQFDARTAMTGLLAAANMLESAEALAEAIAAALGADLHAAARIAVIVTGEAVAGELVEVAAARPVQHLALTSARGTHAPVHHVPAAHLASRAAEPTPAERELLGVVLATTGSMRDQPFGLTSPSLRAERRDVHHERTQRGKHRRRTRTAESLAQPRLFKL